MNLLTENQQNSIYEQVEELIEKDLNNMKNNINEITFCIDYIHDDEYVGLYIFKLNEEMFYESKFIFDTDLALGIKTSIFHSIQSQLKLIKEITEMDDGININKIIDKSFAGISNTDLFNEYVDCSSLQFYAASAIQKQWRKAISNPQYMLCRNRLHREFETL
tara:strand:- start:235 stop:723 length:489 start_codon:yes stop_codon:yes gene_type:complete